MITKKKCYYNKSLKLTNQYYSRFCIDNSIMIAHAGLLTYRTGIVTGYAGTLLGESGSIAVPGTGIQQFNIRATVPSSGNVWAGFESDNAVLDLYGTLFADNDTMKFNDTHVYGPGPNPFGHNINYSNIENWLQITYGVPLPPTNLAATAVSPSQINLSWTAPSDNGGSAITGYKIERSTDGGSTWPTVVNIGNTTSYSDTGLVHSTTYTYRVSAINSAGTGSPSNTATATTFNTVPSSPLGLTATPTSSSQINLSWSAPADNGGTLINGYKIERSTNGGVSWSTLVANTTNTSTTYSDTGLSTAKTYTYRVSAINHVGTSSPSNTTSATTDVTSTDTRLESSGEQRTSYFNGTINYEFYYNGTSANIFYRYSADGGNSWSAPASTASGVLASNSYFTVYGNGSSVIISYANTANVLTKKATINSNASINWSSSSPVTVTSVTGTAPGQQYYPSFTQVGSNLFLEFNVNTKVSGKTGNFGYIYSSSNLGGSWTSQSINPMYSGETNPAVVGIAKYGNTKAIAMFAKYGKSEFNYTTYTGIWSSIGTTSGAGLSTNQLKTQAFSITSNGTCAWVGYVPSNSGGILKSVVFCGTFTFLTTPITSTNVMHPTISGIGNNIHLLPSTLYLEE